MTVLYTRWRFDYRIKRLILLAKNHTYIVQNFFHFDELIFGNIETKIDLSLQNMVYILVLVDHYSLLHFTLLSYLTNLLL